MAGVQVRGLTRQWAGPRMLDALLLASRVLVLEGGRIATDIALHLPCRVAPPRRASGRVASGC